VNPGSKEALFAAFSMAFLVSVVFAVAGTITTGVRDA
jgi:hypothetical protein